MIRKGTYDGHEWLSNTSCNSHHESKSIKQELGCRSEPNEQIIKARFIRHVAIPSLSSL